MKTMYRHVLDNKDVYSYMAKEQGISLNDLASDHMAKASHIRKGNKYIYFQVVFVERWRNL